MDNAMFTYQTHPLLDDTGCLHLKEFGHAGPNDNFNAPSNLTGCLYASHHSDVGVRTLKVKVDWGCD